MKLSIYPNLLPHLKTLTLIPISFPFLLLTFIFFLTSIFFTFNFVVVYEND